MFRLYKFPFCWDYWANLSYSGSSLVDLFAKLTENSWIWFLSKRLGSGIDYLYGFYAEGLLELNSIT